MEDNKHSDHQAFEEILQESPSLRESEKAQESQAVPASDENSPKISADRSENKKEGSESSSPVQESRWKRLFGSHRNRAEKEPDDNEDIYYGLQLKSVDEYRREIADTGEQPLTPNHPTEQYAFLFDDSPGEELDEEIANRFRELHDNRRKRVKEAMEAENLYSDRPAAEPGAIRPLPKLTGIDHGSEIFSASPSSSSAAPAPEEPVPEAAGRLKFFSRRAKKASGAEKPAPDAIQKEAAVQKNSPPAETLPPVQPESTPRKAEEAENSAPPALGVLKPDDDEFTVDAILEQVRQRNLRTARTESAPVASGAALKSPQPEEKAPEESAEAKTLSAKEAEPEKAVDFSSTAEKEPEKGEIPAAVTEPEASAAPEKSVSQGNAFSENPPPAEELPSKKKHSKSARPAKSLHGKTEAPEKESRRSREESRSDPPESNPFVEESLRQPKMPREAREGPCYAPHNKPVHLMDLEVLDFALREEAKFYEEQAQKEQAEQDRRSRKKSMKIKKQQAMEKKFAFSGEEPQEDPNDDYDPSEEELEDFNSPSDAPSISHDLRAGMRELLLRVLVTGLCTGLMGLFGLMGEYNAFLSPSISKEILTTSYMTLNLVFLLLAMGFCFRMIWSGFKALFTFHANSDSALSLASLSALVQSVYACFFPELFMQGKLHLYSVLAVGALFLNSLGKLFMIRRIWSNFHFVSSHESKYAVQLYDDYNTSLKLAHECVLDTPVIAYQKKSGFLTRFMQYSYEPDPLENNSQVLALVGFIASLALCIASLVLSQSAAQAISAFTASACICVPFTGLLGGNLLLKKLSGLAKKCGAMVVGYPAVEKFSSVNAVMLDAHDLYPNGTIILGGIKTFGNQRIDEAILEATSLMCAAGGPLVSVFDQIIKTRREILPKADKPVYEDGRGLTGWVSGHRVLIGNRDLLAAHHIDPPSRDFEKKYANSGKKVTYLAIGGELVAMFLLTYRTDSRRARELQRLEDNGVSLIVRTCDPNITGDFLAGAFGIDPHSIRILPDALGEEYVRITKDESPRTPALLATRGRPVSMLRMISACIRTRSNLTLAAVMQTVSVILGFVLISFLACYSGLQQLSTLSLILYEVFWSFVILFFPRLHKP